MAAGVGAFGICAVDDILSGNDHAEKCKEQLDEASALTDDEKDALEEMGIDPNTCRGPQNYGR